MRTAEAQGVTEAASPQQGGTLGFFLPMILIFGIFYFLLIRPQAKQRKKHQALLQNLKSGDLVITASGIHGKVAGIADNLLTLEVSENVRFKMEKSQVAQVKSSGP